MLTRTDGRGIATTYVRNTDPESFVTEIEYPSTLPTGVTAIGDVYFGYDDFGRRDTESDGTTGSGGKTYTYDDLDELETLTTSFASGPSSQEVSYTHYNDGTRASMKIPSNVANPLTSINSGEFTYDYDKGRRLSSVTCPWPKAVGSSTPEQMSYLYYANNWLNTYNDSQFETTYTYDARGFVNSLTNTSNLSSWSGDIISAFPRPSGTLVRDAMGNLGGYTSELPEYGVHVNDASRIVGYTYNTSNSPATANLDQLTGETSEPDPGIGGSGFSDTYTNDFGYDAAWNDTTYDISGSSIGTITFDADNQISVSGSTYSFDGDGNPTTYGGKTFNFDPEDRFTYLSSPSFSASYDGDGLRTIAQPAGSTVYFVYDGDFPVAEETYSSSTASLAAVNAFGADGWRQRCYLVTSPPSGDAYRSFSFDPMGNVVQRGDPGSPYDVYDTAQYEAYGKRDADIQADDGANPALMQDPARWGGQWGYYTDQNTGLVFLTHRYYNFHTGQFMSRDPIGYNGGVNLYAFGDNPVNRRDPEGTQVSDAASDAGILPPYWDGRQIDYDGFRRSVHQGSAFAIQGMNFAADFIPGMTLEEALGGKDASGAKLSAGVRLVLLAGTFAPVVGRGAKWLRFLEDNEGVLGAHILEKHVGQSDFDLWWRIVTSNVRAASTFSSKNVAAEVVGETIRANTSRITSWLQGSSRGDLPLMYTGKDIVGRVLDRGTLQTRDTTDAVVLLRKGAAGLWSVYTAYPK